MITTIQLDKSLKQRLDELKIHHRETYNELIERLIDNSNNSNEDKESLMATIEVLSDSELMKSIRESLQRINSGDYGTPLEEVEKALGL